MGLNLIVREAGLAMLGVSMLAVGCQQQGGPMHMSVVSDVSAGQSAGPDSTYVNPDPQDNDSARGPVESAVATTESVFGNIFSPLVDVPTHGFKWLSGERPSVAVRLLEDPTSADNRRKGINKLAEDGFLTHDVFEKRCRQIAQFDADFTVRATALRTSNRARDARATALFIKGLTDTNEWVRLESAKGLANLPDPNASTPLIAMANDHEESRDVRVAAVDALKHYRTLPVERALCAMLHDKTFVVSWQARRSLRYLTARDFQYDEAAWLNYFTEAPKPLG